MTYISDNVIPGNHGKTFTTNVEKASDRLKLEAAILQVEGVVKLIFSETFPLEFTVHTDRVVQVSDIQRKAMALNYHVFAKGPFFPLF